MKTQAYINKVLCDLAIKHNLPLNCFRDEYPNGVEGIKGNIYYMIGNYALHYDNESDQIFLEEFYQLEDGTTDGNQVEVLLPCEVRSIVKDFVSFAVRDLVHNAMIDIDVEEEDV